MTRTKTMLAGCALAAAALAAPAQVLPPPQNVLQLQTTGTVEVQQDLLQITLSTARDGTDPALVQSQLRTALDAALAEAKRNAQPGQMDVRTGNFAIYPRNNREGRISGWTGTAELVLEGRDFPRITQTAGKIQTMTLAGVSFGLSREQRAKVETEAQAQAIERFKAKAGELAKAFGFSGYTLREVSVNTNEPGFQPRMRMQAMDAKVASAEAVPVEPGKSAVTVMVSGSVQLR
ncbi:SIMPL domain-containing protein [Ramlibacter sp. USB13]|uniref:SIMPL domain-containing protein n=1 Tax=Ramlibacter cellulosilyticus TaxID=2764187 RepID=A0A923SAZ2_9BURK|nr:SIMPL domain-containing protein [Ramlibacter cellulosilyticus]MBC5783295.1 SIMPL domain-containing protein [Ramlibacter cellulosilyticus]